MEQSCPPTSSAPTRGRTRMKDLAKSSEKKIVEVNSSGQPIGSNSSKMQSYTGNLVRCEVPITIDDWSHVPKDLKEKIWECIQV